MDESLQIVQNKQARGQILRVLQFSSPQPLSFQIIEVCLIDAGLGMSPAALDGQIKYLQDKGYIECKETELKSIHRTIRILALTPKGVDLLERTISDPGVMLV